jgi:nitrite reductase/ring-hydroxylating ferredoxin subunit
VTPAVGERADRGAVPVCPVTALEPGRAYSFNVDGSERTLDLVVIRFDGELLAFENRCPHLGTPLNLLPDHFLDAAGREIICATHGARFELPSGLCLFGPCKDDELRRLDTLERDGTVYVILPAHVR